MGVVGKIFIVLNLVFSVALLALIGSMLATSENYKDMLELERIAHQMTARERDGYMNKLLSERKSLTSQNESLLLERDSLAERVQELNADLEESNSLLGGLQGSIQSMGQQINTMTGTIDDFGRRLEDVQRQNIELNRERNQFLIDKDRLRVANATLMAQVGRLRDDYQTLENRYYELHKAHEDSLQQIAMITRLHPEVHEELAMSGPPLSGYVAGVGDDPDLGVVVISIGRDEGVRVGQKFIVYREGGDYVGQIQIERVYPDAAAGRTLRSFQVRPIQVGDRVVSKF